MLPLCSKCQTQLTIWFDIARLDSYNKISIGGKYLLLLLLFLLLLFFFHFFSGVKQMREKRSSASSLRVCVCLWKTDEKRVVVLCNIQQMIMFSKSGWEWFAGICALNVYILFGCYYTHAHTPWQKLGKQGHFSYMLVV